MSKPQAKTFKQAEKSAPGMDSFTTPKPKAPMKAASKPFNAAKYERARAKTFGISKSY